MSVSQCWNQPENEAENSKLLAYHGVQALLLKEGVRKELLAILHCKALLRALI